MDGLLASAYLRTVFLWMPNSLAIARLERPRSLERLLHGLPPNPLSRRGFPAWRCRRLANSAAAVQCGAVGLDGVEGCQALLGVAAHAVDPTVKAGAISERTIGGTENSRARRRLLCGDRASPVLHEELTVQALMDLHLRSGVARPLLTRQQLQGTPVVLDGVVPGHLAAVLEAEYLIQGHR